MKKTLLILLLAPLLVLSPAVAAKKKGIARVENMVALVQN